MTHQNRKATPAEMAYARQVIEEAFPGLSPQFGGRGGRMAPRIRTLHFRLRDESGSFCSNVVWLLPDGIMSLTPACIQKLVARSNGRKPRNRTRRPVRC